MKLSLKMNNKPTFLLVLSFMLMFSASAQKTFKYQAKLDPIDSTGFYKIALSPAFIAKSNAGLTDIRIIDKKGNFVPYITSENLPHIDSEVFIPYPEVRQKRDTGTAYVVESIVRQPVNRLWLKLKNTAVKRTVNLYGSDDLQQWFAIDEDIPLQAAARDNNGSYMQSISFPASNYKYLKVLVNDKNKAPLKFLQAGIYTERSVLNTYPPVPMLNFTKKDSGKTTRITINLDDNYLVNMIILHIDQPKFYKRDVAVYAYGKQGRQLITNSDVMSGKNGFILINAKTNKLEVEVDNGDNPPLHLAGVNVAQADDPIVAYLEAGQSYKLLTGDSAAVAPVYDLKFFVDSIHAQLPKISEGKVEPNVLSAGPEVKPPARDYTTVIWIVILGALLLLTLLTIKMTGEVNKKNKENK